MSGLILAEEYPAEPLLSIAELLHPEHYDEVVDLRNQVPHLIPYLRPDEVVVRIVDVENVYNPRLPSSADALRQLTGVASIDQIGERGPAIASLSHPENADDPSLTKFERVFGRDSTIVALLLKDRHPKLLRSTLLHLAELQGTKFDEQSGEKPGGIIHDNNDPETPEARKFSKYLGWKFPTYLTVDAPALFLKGIYESWQADHDKQATGDWSENDIEFLDQDYIDKDGQPSNMLEAFKKSLSWLETELARNPEGLLEFYRPLAKGMDNTSWRDSFHAYIHADGSFANHEAGIASIEVQGYVYDALLNAAEIYRTNFGDETKAEELESKAENIRRVVLDKFWVENKYGGYFGLATDRDEGDNLRLMKVRTSGMGQLLNSRLLDGDEPELEYKRRGVIRNLFSPEMIGPGNHVFRTMANDEAGFNPFSYHNGGEWYWEAGWIAQGLERHEQNGLARVIYGRITTGSNKTGCLPEVVQSDNDPEPKLSTQCIYVWDKLLDMVYLLERAPQQLQAWTAAAVYLAKSKNPIPGVLRQANVAPLSLASPSNQQFERGILFRLAA